jgi:hypothetical protein
MITLSINGTSVDPSRESEVAHAINGWHSQGIPVCVQLRIKTGDIDLVLATNPCGGARGGGRPPNTREQAIFDLWGKRHLQEGRFAGGELIAFIKQIT